MLGSRNESPSAMALRSSSEGPADTPPPAIRLRGVKFVKQWDKRKFTRENKTTCRLCATELLPQRAPQLGLSDVNHALASPASVLRVPSPVLWLLEGWTRLR